MLRRVKGKAFVRLDMEMQANPRASVFDSFAQTRAVGLHGHS